MLEKLFCRFSKFRFTLVRALNHRAQRFQHHREVGFKLLYRLAELGDLGALVVEEEVE